MIRKATVSDVKPIKGLINLYADRGDMLPRALGELYDSLRDFHVYEDDGRVIGVAALHVGWEGLAEVRSVAVDPAYLGKGIGRALVSACLEDAKALGVREVFVLTYVDKFFRKMGFSDASHDDLPQKVWTECRNKCTKYPDTCNETAMTLNLD
ncbi:MAG: N-acetyltransferase [Nitrospirae bacterium]|nr:N-acetyltransferase [Nitrospirota bacterium]